MPVKWVSPELAMHYKGVSIYYTYKNGCFSEPNEYWYTQDNDEDNDFDISDLIGELEEKGIEVHDDASHEVVLMLALDNGLIETFGTMTGRVTTTKEAIEAFQASIFMGDEEVSIKELLDLCTRYRDGKVQFSTGCTGLTRDHVMQTAKALASIQSGPHSDSIRYEVFGESGIVVIRDRQISVILDDPKKKERERLKEAIRGALSEAFDMPIDVPQNVLAAGARSVLTRMKRESRPYWTGWDISSEALQIVKHGLCSMEAEYPKFLSGVLKDLNKCLVSGTKQGSVEPASLSEICRSLNSKLRKAQQDAKRA